MIDRDTPFSLTTTGTSYYDAFLNPGKKEYLNNKKNLRGDVIWMSPQDYLKYCAQIFNTDYASQLRAGSDKKSLEDFDKLVSEGKKMWMPYLNFTVDGGQEGRHRAVWAMDNNIDSIPVLVVDWYNKDIAEKEKQEERRAYIENKIDKIMSTHRYKRDSIDDLKEDLQSYIDQEFYTKNKPFSLTEEGDELVIEIEGFKMNYPKSDYVWPEDETDEFDYDDLLDDEGVQNMISGWGKVK